MNSRARYNAGRSGRPGRRLLAGRRGSWAASSAVFAAGCWIPPGGWSPPEADAARATDVESHRQRERNTRNMDKDPRGQVDYAVLETAPFWVGQRIRNTNPLGAASSSPCRRRTPPTLPRVTARWPLGGGRRGIRPALRPSRASLPDPGGWLMVVERAGRPGPPLLARPATCKRGDVFGFSLGLKGRGQRGTNPIRRQVRSAP